MDIRQIYVALRAAWWLPACGLLVGISAALLLSLIQKPIYTATTQFFVSATESGTTSDAVQGSQFSQDRVTSYAQVLEGPLIAGRVVNLLGLDESASELSRQITATVVPDSVLIDVSVDSSSPQQARSIAQALGPIFTQRVDELETPRDGEKSLVKVEVNEVPLVPLVPSSPQTARNAFLGALIGLLVGGVLAILRQRLDRSVKRTEVVREATGSPVVGTIFYSASLGSQGNATRVGTNRAPEDFRQLRTNLQFLDVDKPPTVVLITSALPSEGKTTTVINLARALTDSGKTVTIVEADLRRPQVTQYLGLIGDIGLTNVLRGELALDDAIQVLNDGLLKILPAGPVPPNPGELLVSNQVADLLNRLRHQSDYVLVDGAPLLPVADSSGLSVRTDGVLLTVRYGKTHRDQLHQAAANLHSVGARTLGVILNMVPPRTDVAAAYGYGYGYGQEEN